MFDDLFVEHYLFYPKRSLRVTIKLIERVTGIKVPEGVDREKMPVGWVDKGPACTKIRHDDLKYSARPCNPMEFLHHPRQVLQMLNGVVSEDLVERGIIEGIREPVEVMDDIGLGARVDVDPDHSGLFLVAAPKV